MIREKKTVYLTPTQIRNIQSFAENTGYTFNTALMIIVNDYFDDERKVMVDYLKGENDGRR